MTNMMEAVKVISRCSTLYRDEALKQEGLGGYQQIYLQRICEMPGTTQEELARAIHVNKSNAARQVAALEAGGFVARTPHESDRRQQRVYPTKEGERLYPMIRKAEEEWNRLLLSGFSPEEQETLASMLEQVKVQAIALAERQKGGGEG